MTSESGRYSPLRPVSLADGWTLRRVTPPSRLYGANGLRAGPDGRIYVAQVSGSQISAIDTATGAIETISPLGGDIVAPDDLAFDTEGNLYATEITEGRVSMLAPGGGSRVVRGDIPVANPITVHQDRLITGEFRPGGRILELDRDGGPPRIIASDLPMPNAFEVGPDGRLYFPLLGVNEIWRVDFDGGAPEKVAGDLGGPSAVKFDATGHIISTQVTSGQVLRIDPRNGARNVLADLAPGLDNLTTVAGRIFVSNVSGEIVEIGAGQARCLVQGGFNWPLGLACDVEGTLYAADGPLLYALPRGRAPQVIANLFVPGSPGYMRGLARCGPGVLAVSTANGEVSLYDVERHETTAVAQGFDQLYGVAAGDKGELVFAERGAGRVHILAGGEVSELARNLRQPTGVALDVTGRCFVSEAGAGRVLQLTGGRSETVLDGLVKPQGVMVSGETLYVVDAGAQELVALDLHSGARRTIASALPVGAPPGVVPKVLGPIGQLSGPMGPFAAIAAGPRGEIYISADAEGSILELSKHTSQEAGQRRSASH